MSVDGCTSGSLEAVLMGVRDLLLNFGHVF